MLAGTVYGQTEVGYSNFGKTQKGLTVVEFWADWNERNMCHWVRDFRDISIPWKDYKRISSRPCKRRHQSLQEASDGKP